MICIHLWKLVEMVLGTCPASTYWSAETLTRWVLHLYLSTKSSVLVTFSTVRSLYGRPLPQHDQSIHSGQFSPTSNATHLSPFLVGNSLRWSNLIVSWAVDWQTLFNIVKCSAVHVWKSTNGNEYVLGEGANYHRGRKRLEAVGGNHP